MNKQRTTNSTLAIGGVSSPLDSFVVAENSVLRTNFCAEKPAHRQSAKRWNQLMHNALKNKCLKNRAQLKSRFHRRRIEKQYSGERTAFWSRIGFNSWFSAENENQIQLRTVWKWHLLHWCEKEIEKYKTKNIF